MAYKLMLRVIAQGKRDRQWLINRCNVYYAAGQLTDEEYSALMEAINEKYPVEDGE